MLFPCHPIEHTMPDTTQLTLGLGLPLFLAAVLAWVGSRLPTGGSWGAIVGLAVGFVIAHYAFVGQWPPLPPPEAPHRTVVFAAGVALVAIALSAKSSPWALRALLAMGGQVLIVWFVLRPIPASVLPSAKLWTYVGSTAAIGIALTALVETLARRSGAIAVTMVLGPLASGIGAINVLTGNAKLGWLGASVGMMVLGWFLAGLLSKSLTLGRGPVIVCLVMLSPLLAYGYFDSNTMTNTQLGLLVLAPFLGWMPELLPRRTLTGWKREPLRLLVVGIPILIALGLAKAKFDRDNEQSTASELM